MDKKEILKRKRKRNNIIKTFVLVIAFVVAIGTTFGVTMAYFGGTSGTFTSTMTLKTGVYINAPAPTNISQSMYVVPSQVIEAGCTVNVKSAKPNGDLSTGAAASKGLLRAKITFSAGGTGATLTSGGNTYFPVKIGSETTASCNLVPWTGEGGDGYYYLMKGTTINATSSTEADWMKEIDTTAGIQTLNFTLKISIPSTLTNADGGTPITLTISYEVIQSDWYNDSTSAVYKNVSEASKIFNIVDDTNASY